MITQVKKFMEQWNMVPKGAKVLAGVSGGADSVCLCLLLSELSTPMNFTLEVIHVEHGIRGRESQEDARFVEKICDRLGLVCHMQSVDVPEYAAEHHMGKRRPRARCAIRRLCGLRNSPGMFRCGLRWHITWKIMRKPCCFN